MYIRALGIGLGVRLGDIFADFDIKLHRQLLGRITGVIVAGLVLELSMYGVSAKRRMRLGKDYSFHNYIPGVDAQLFRRIKGKAGQYSGGILDFGDHQVRRRSEAQAGGNHFRLCRLVRVDVIASLYVKRKLHRKVLALLHLDRIQRREINVAAAQGRGRILLG